MEKLSRNAYKLFEEVLKLSKAKKWEEAIKEWEQIMITQADDEEDYGSCTCGHHPIKEMIQLFNTKNANEIIVGNCCINRFFGNSEYNKIFGALKKGKVNKSMIEDSFKKEVINAGEYEFMKEIHKKRKFTTKQKNKFDSITKKILKVYKK